MHKAFYVDDCLTGADNIQEAKAIREELNQLLSKGKMTLCKWRSSSTELLESIPKELRETSNLDISLSPAEQGNTLGLHWDTIQDCLYISTHNIDSKLPATKRRISSAIAKTFDIMG